MIRRFTTLLVLACWAMPALSGDEGLATHESKFVEADGVRLHYLDFGGEGLPVVFIHAGQRGAETWASFAPRFTDRYRALALTARGVSESEGEEGDTETRAGNLISFLDALDIERAVFIGNSGPGLDMTYLAEHHPDRVVGLVYLANVPPDGEFEVDPSGGLRMAVRAMHPAMVDDPYRPGYLDDPEHRIDIPALTFVGSTGYRGWGNMSLTLAVITRASEVGTDWITDPEAKAFFERAVADQAFRDEVRQSWEEAVVPAVRAREDVFRAAFGEHLRVVELDIPFVTGYQYLDEPDLIEPHIRRFLGDLFSLTSPEALARQVTIYRDAYGIPHVHGETDAAAVFGLMYAHAEDDFQRIERTALLASGRLAEVTGEEGLAQDLRYRALETERYSRLEYENASDEFRAIADAWAAGLNYYREQHPDRRESPLARFEPWHMFARARILANETWELVPEHPSATEFREAGSRWAPPRGSNMWMVGPSRSASGHPMLFINPHVSTSDAVLIREGHLISDEGLNMYGGFWPGQPFPSWGHTPRHGWAVTVNFPDVVDFWELTFDHADDPLAYRYGDGYRTAEQWTETVRVKTDAGVEEREVTFRKSHHGPIIAAGDGKPLAMNMARRVEGGYDQQRYAMSKARSLEEFREAVGRLDYLIHNIGYADVDGNIWYVYNSPVPRRSGQFDTRRRLDGSDPQTEWQGYHSLDELPQVLNPDSGWIVNTNTSPFKVTSAGDNPEPVRYPGYMVGEAREHRLYEMWRDHAASRLRASRQLVSAADQFTFDEFIKAVTSRRAFQADEDVPALVAEWERLEAVDTDRAEVLRTAVESLQAWDRTSSLESTAMTLYMHWSLALRGMPETWGYTSLDAVISGEWSRIRALETAEAELERDWGTASVPWAEVSRLQRPVDGAFSDERSSTPVAGSSGLFGLLHEFNPMPAEGQKRWYGRGGNSYVSVIEFAPEVKARTIIPFGQSADPQSSHYSDQSELYGRGEFKQAWTTLEEVRANAVHAYRPGEEK